MERCVDEPASSTAPAVVKKRSYFSRNKDTCREADKRKRRRWIEKDVCVGCGKPKMANSNRVCEKHWFMYAGKRIGSATLKTANALREKLERQRYTCPYTGDKLVPGVNCHLDHILPVSRFPELVKDLNNVEWVSERANMAKSDLTKEEFLAFCRTVSKRAVKEVWYKGRLFYV